MRSDKFWLVGLAMTVPFVVYGVAVLSLYIGYNRNCEGYLKRAADANTVEVARRELARAVDYIERQGMTNGYTSVLYRTPDEDVEFWHGNLKAALGELDKCPPGATQLERSNLLMKLRETLLDAGKQGTSVTAPTGISRYPSNGAWGFFGIMAGLLFAVGIGLVLFSD